MAFDDKTRNRLQNFVSGARTLLTKEFTRQLQNDYGLDPTTGEISDIDSLTFLDDTKRQTARLLRDILDIIRQAAHLPKLGTHLNELFENKHLPYSTVFAP